MKSAACAMIGVLGLSLYGGARAQVCVDGDVDGVCDQNDACLYTGTGSFVDVRGCALQGDADADGIADQADRCPYSPAGALIDSEGCALDGDGDGVPDGVDRCPDAMAAGPVDVHGCTDPAGTADPMTTVPRAPVSPPAAARWPLVIEGYTRNSSNIPPAALAQLRALAPRISARLDAEPASNLEITGFADRDLEGPLAARLSENRAALLRAALGASGVPMGRIYARAGGVSADGAHAQIDWRPQPRE